MTDRIYIIAILYAICAALTMSKIWSVIESPERRALFQKFDQTLSDILVMLCGLFWPIFWIAALIDGFTNYKGKVNL